MPDDMTQMVDAILDGAEPVGETPPPRVFEKPMSPDDARRATLTRVVEGLGSDDPSMRAAASAAVDQFIRKLGLSWQDVADAIEHLSAVENWRADAHTRAPRRDTGWSRFVDGEDRVGYGRWMKGRALTVRVTKFMGSSWCAAINGHVIRDGPKARLFRNPDSAKSVVEAFAGEN